MSAILGRWKVVGSNRPRSEDENSNSIGTSCIFLNSGVHFIILKMGQKFKLNYKHNEKTNTLELVFSDGSKLYGIEMFEEDPKRIIVSEEESDYFDIYEFLGPD